MEIGSWLTEGAGILDSKLSQVKRGGSGASWKMDGCLKVSAEGMQRTGKVKTGLKKVWESTLGRSRQGRNSRVSKNQGSGCGAVA